MFFKAIEDLKKIRKFVDYRVIEMEDYPLLSNLISDISYQLTIVINDMKRADQVAGKVKNDEVHTNEDIRKR